MDALKNWFNEDFFRKLCAMLHEVDSGINQAAVLKELMHELEALELKQRIERVQVVLREHLPPDFEEAVNILKQIAPQIDNGFFGVFIPDFIGRYGEKHFDFSLESLREVTQYSTSEFAIREFLRRDFERTHKSMLAWSQDANEHVRRLSSEGLRPRLPWSFKLFEVIHKPQLSAEILTRLSADTSEYVRKSVANHVNDISKDNPDYALDLLESWDAQNAHTRWIIKHAARTLIKAGNPRALALFGFEREPKVNIKMTNKNMQVKRGDSFQASWNLRSSSDNVQKLLVDYAIIYVRQNGKNQRKVFKLKEFELAPKESINLSCKTSFRDMSTRKHYAGTHTVELQVNGLVLHAEDFEFLG